MEHTIIKPSVPTTNNDITHHTGHNSQVQENNEKFTAALFCNGTTTISRSGSESAVKRYSTQTTLSNPLTPTATAVLRLKRKKWYPKSLNRVFYHFKVI